MSDLWPCKNPASPGVSHRTSPGTILIIMEQPQLAMGTTYNSDGYSNATFKQCYIFSLMASLLLRYIALSTMGYYLHSTPHYATNNLIVPFVDAMQKSSNMMSISVAC